MGYIRKAALGLALADLKLRNAVPDTREQAAAGDLALLDAMEKAEAGGVFEYLAKKRKNLPEVFYVERGD
jgi:hypothetical protein